MEYSKYIFCNLPALRQITNCDESILDACVEESVLTKDERDELITQDFIERNYNFWNILMDTEDCLRKLIDIFFKNNQILVSSILRKAHRDDNSDQKYTFIKNLKPLKVKVRKTEDCSFNEHDDYKLESPGIGLALIINIAYYETCGWHRHGSKQDVIYLCDLWTKMGYKVIQRDGKINHEMFKGIIKEFIETVYANEHCMSFIIYIGCHGEDEKLIMSNGTRVPIISGLLNWLALELNADDFKNKPKLIILQVPGSTMKNDGRKWLQMFFQNTVICYLSEPIRHLELNVNIGSWLLYNLVDILMREAYNKDLISMLDEMQENVKKILDDETNELLVIENYGMKKMYFNVWNKNKMEYANYILRQTTYLSAICRQKVPDMADIINECVREDVFTTHDREFLKQNPNDITTLFWQLVSIKTDYLNILKDIFYHRKLSEVVGILNRAKKDDGTDEKYRAIEDKKPLTVKVIKPKKFRKNTLDFYGLQEEFMGLALVINIIEYDKVGFRRHGAEYDTTYMTELWSQMGYKVIHHEGRICKPDFKGIVNKLLRKIKTLNKLCRKNVAQSCIVYVGCHGVDGELIMSDHARIDLYKEFVLKFKGAYLDGAPKIFIFQSCQIHKSHIDHRIEKTIQEEINLMKDLTLCFSTLRGEQSNRDSFVGSLYVYAFTYVFMNNAYKMELQKMLAEVTKYMNNEFDFNDESQMPHYISHKMKSLYFNIKP